MPNVASNFKINPNQNLWGLVVSYASLGSAEHWGLKAQFWFSTPADTARINSAEFRVVGLAK
jgi:hypothetical protein